MILVTSVCVCVCLIIKLHMTAQSGHPMLLIALKSHSILACACALWKIERGHASIIPQAICFFFTCMKNVYKSRVLEYFNKKKDLRAFSIKLYQIVRCYGFCLCWGGIENGLRGA